MREDRLVSSSWGGVDGASVTGVLSELTNSVVQQSDNDSGTDHGCHSAVPTCWPHVGQSMPGAVLCRAAVVEVLHGR